jgi:hypothetical protein
MYIYRELSIKLSQGMKPWDMAVDDDCDFPKREHQRQTS